MAKPPDSDTTLASGDRLIGIEARRVKPMIDTAWIILGMISAALLLFSWKKRSAIWGGLFPGAIVGLIIAIYFVIRGRGFDWLIIGKGAIVGILLGAGAELLGKAADFIKRK